MTQDEKKHLLIALMDIVGEMGLDTELEWSHLGVNAFDSMHQIAANIVELYADWKSLDPNDRELIMLATITKLTLENFVLNVHKIVGNQDT
jgi:hypothetical protein